MRFGRVVLVLFAAGLGLAQAPSEKEKPLTKTQLRQLVATGMDNERLADVVAQRGIDFQVPGEYLEALRKAGAQPVLLRVLGGIALRTGQVPLDRDLLRELVAAGLDSLTLAEAVLKRGIDFQPTTEYLQALQSAGTREALLGAQDALLKALREASLKFLTADQLLSLLAGGVPNLRVAALVRARGIDFKPSEEYLETLRIAGADAALLEAVQEAKRPPEFNLARTLGGHSGGVTSVAFSPDGRYLASGGRDKTIKLWEVDTGREVRTLTGHTDAVLSVAFTRDGQQLASGSVDQTVRLWEVSTGAEVRVLTGFASLFTLAFSPDGRYLAAGSYDSKIRIWDVATAREVRTLEGHANYLLSLTFSPDGWYLASGSGDHTARLWKVDDWREARVLKGHSQSVHSVAFSPNGRLLATGSSDSTVRLWHTSTGREESALGGRGSRISSVAFSPDGRYIVAGGEDRTVKLWEVAAGRETQTLTGHSDSVDCVAFSPDGHYIASASEDGTVRLWRLGE